ncbi:MAG: ribosome recycling factor [Actinobacteria bacterium]|nr:ribosome recycling factor [Actinomycetota bacterium]NDG77140.1 ribosome recycling factor [Acidimicrobiia bacterium]NBO80887.1 ribosome recycling factor [Actinomycetota bacterium]NBP17727.1 ribosome recycling factor [Actinomycetota bacterium]NBR76175.1 ribosome recycling factor [Actinomycetota bacterium]
MIDETLLESLEKMQKAVEHVQHEFVNVRTGRASPHLIEKLNVDYYGAPVPLQQLASFQVPEARMLVVKPHDRTAIGAIEKTLSAANLGVNPSNDGQVIRLAFPALTEERRKEYVKVVKNLAEEGRVVVRAVRRDARKALETAEKDHDISKDELERAEKELDKMTQEHVDIIDKASVRKEQEVMEV